MAPVVGPCKGTFPRWFYDQKAGSCKHFLYGGCQGNHNNFLQESDCVSECIQKGEPGRVVNPLLVSEILILPLLFGPVSGPAFKPASAAPPVTRQTETAEDGRRLDKAAFPSPASRSHVGSDAPASKPVPVMGGHPVPETGETLSQAAAAAAAVVPFSFVPAFCPPGAILPLALGLLITALLLLMIGCRLRLVRRRMKKARPLSTEESDYLINGMYL